MVTSFTGVPVTIGVFTDVQYATKPDQTLKQLYGLTEDEANGRDIHSERKYSLALQKAATAIKHFNSNKVTATLHLGDIVDGNKTTEETYSDFSSVMETLKPIESPLLHVLGNHCLSIERQDLQKALGLMYGSYYVYDISSKWRLIVLDTVDVSLDRNPTHPAYKEAKEYLSTHSNDPNANQWNGTISSVQKGWLRSMLQQTRNDGKMGIVCGHMPVRMPDSYGPIPPHSMYDFEAVAAIFEEFKDVVKAYFAGHFHQGGYVQKNNIHYVTFESILDSDDDEEGSFGIVRLFDDGIEIEGHGDMTSRKLKF